MASTNFLRKNAEGQDVYRTVACNGRDANGKVIRKTFSFVAASLKKAKKEGEQLEFNWKQGGKKNLTNQTFLNLISEWKASDKYRKLSPKTIDRYNGMLENKIIPEFGVWELEKIRPLHISRFIYALGEPGCRKDKNNLKPYSDKTIQGYYILLHTLFEQAVIWEMVSENVCKKIDKPKISRHQAKFYDKQQIDKMLEHLDGERETLEESLLKRNPNHRNKTEQRKKELMQERRYMYFMHRAYVYLALDSACRRSELCGLNWNDMNLDSTLMTVRCTVQYSHLKGKFERDSLKNGSPEKSMYLSKKVIGILREYKEEQEKYKEVMGEKWVESGKVFTSVVGDMIHADNISAWFKKFLERHNLPYITLHEVRHTSISFMLMENTPIKVVADRAGHNDVSVTTRTYGHVFDGSKRDVVNVVDKMFDRGVREDTW